ncbi:MAG: M20/M25/M40 family metallo-hydrolase [Acidobacteriota bacterium]|nr:M20/M25/M40 family metallo-hydrolase [Blastocatellia bacterium]MDW8412983.1 M20/M25/M40 family metallo-hydrolase [Acidobacteriota bacterium]
MYLCLPTSSAQTTIEKLIRNASVNACINILEQISNNELMQEQKLLCGFPAPPLKEAARAKHIKQRLKQYGLEAEHDSCGNVTAVLAGKSSDFCCVSAHLDTVGSHTVEVRQEGNRYYGYGISDNCAGLAALLGIAAAITKAKLRPRRSILFAATVGEEAEGDLRGCKYLFEQGKYAGRISYFVSLDGPGLEQIVTVAIGVRRVRVIVTGKGGHSWLDRETPNPIHAAARIIAKLADLSYDGSALNVCKVGGGCNINTIPTEAWFEVDLRADDNETLAKLELHLQEKVFEALAEEHAHRSNGHHLQVKFVPTGNRPAGRLAKSSRIVELAAEATRAVGANPVFIPASTDSNIPLSLGIEAVTIGAGGNGGAFHTSQEWYDPEGRYLALKRALLLILALTGLQKGKLWENQSSS